MLYDGYLDMAVIDNRLHVAWVKTVDFGEKKYVDEPLDLSRMDELPEALALEFEGYWTYHAQNSADRGDPAELAFRDVLYSWRIDPRYIPDLRWLLGLQESQTWDIVSQDRPTEDENEWIGTYAVLKSEKQRQILDTEAGQILRAYSGRGDFEAGPVAIDALAGMVDPAPRLKAMLEQQWAEESLTSEDEKKMPESDVPWPAKPSAWRIQQDGWFAVYRDQLAVYAEAWHSSDNPRKAVLGAIWWHGYFANALDEIYLQDENEYFLLQDGLMTDLAREIDPVAWRRYDNAVKMLHHHAAILSEHANVSPEEQLAEIRHDEHLTRQARLGTNRSRLLAKSFWRELHRAYRRNLYLPELMEMADLAHCGANDHFEPEELVYPVFEQKFSKELEAHVAQEELNFLSPVAPLYRSLAYHQAYYRSLNNGHTRLRAELDGSYAYAKDRGYKGTLAQFYALDDSPTTKLNKEGKPYRDGVLFRRRVGRCVAKSSKRAHDAYMAWLAATQPQKVEKPHIRAWGFKLKNQWLRQQGATRPVAVAA